MTKWFSGQGFVLAVGLLFGLAAGAWSMRLYFDHTLMSWSPGQRFVARMDEDLSLTPQQRAGVAAILADQRSRMEGLRSDWRRQVEVLGRQGEDRIAGLLTPAQLDRFVKTHDSLHAGMDRFLWTSETEPTALAIAPQAR